MHTTSPLMIVNLVGFLVFLLASMVATAADSAPPASSAPQPEAVSRDYRLAAGDTIRIVVFQNPDLTLDTRVSEGGTINYPLVGGVTLGGLTLSEAEQVISRALQSGGFVKQPQVNIVLQQIIGNQVSVLGYVNRPGSFPLMTFNMRLTQLLAMAGGIAQLGSNKVVVSGTRDGTAFSREIDVRAIYLDGRGSDDMILSGGDSVYVPKAPMYYVYGEVNRPGAYPVEHSMTVRQAIATGGGPTLRGSENRVRLDRGDGKGGVQRYKPELDDLIKPDDVIYVKESIF